MFLGDEAQPELPLYALEDLHRNRRERHSSCSTRSTFELALALQHDDPGEAPEPASVLLIEYRKLEEAISGHLHTIDDFGTDLVGIPCSCGSEVQKS